MDIHNLLVIGHIIGTALGVGGATSADILFMKELGKDKLSPDALGTLKTMSLIVWVGALLLVISGIGFLWLHQIESPGSALIYSEKLGAKLAVVAIVILNGLVLNFKVTPLLGSFVGKSGLKKFILSRATLFFTCGAVSIVSWYTALILGAIRIRGLEFWDVFGVYLLVLVIAILVANIGGRIMTKK